MAERHRLGGLQMREARHRVGRVLGRARGQRAHQLGELGVQAVDGVAHPQADVGGHLVVAAARGVQPPARIARALDQPRLDVGVDVLQRRVEHEAPGLDVRGDGL